MVDIRHVVVYRDVDGQRGVATGPLYGENREGGGDIPRGQGYPDLLLMIRMQIAE